MMDEGERLVKPLHGRLRRVTDSPGKLERLLERTLESGATGELLWRVTCRSRGSDVVFGDPNRQFFLASATKLFVTAILAQLQDEGRIHWSDPVGGFFDSPMLAGVLSDAAGGGQPITIAEVMAHTAGLPDYFEGERADGGTTFARVIEQDMAWDFDDVLRWSKAMKPARRGRGHYSDTGYQLLGALIERVEGKSFGAVVDERIAQRLALLRTFVFGSLDVDRVDEIAQMRLGHGVVRIPLAMASVQADGGAVSTLDEAHRFIGAFFGGALFDPRNLPVIESDWHRIFPPFAYGYGVMRYHLPGIMTGFRALPPMVGHGGASGVVLFTSADRDITVVGTVNQVAKRSLAYRLMTKSLLSVRA